MLTYLVIYSLVSGPCILFLNKYLPSGFTVFLKPTHIEMNKLCLQLVFIYFIYYLLRSTHRCCEDNPAR